MPSWVLEFNDWMTVAAITVVAGYGFWWAERMIGPDGREDIEQM